jgi:DNA-binding transcriptional MerR regulator
LSEERDNVIHVAFGRDGVGTRIAAPAPLAPSPSEAPKPHKPSDDPLADLYSTADVAKLFDLKESRLRSWAKSGFITPSATVGKKQLYTFQDLVSVRAAKALLERGVPQKRVKDSVDAIRRTLPKVTRPLAELRVTEEGGSVVMRDRLGAFVPTTGQQVIDFDVSAVRDDVVRVLRTGPTAEARRSAYEHYLEGCRLDEDEATFERAEAAYLAALRLDASLGNAHTNLGNLCYRRGRVEDARRHYTNALRIDGEQPEAHYNLGFLALDAGDPTNAVLSFERALASDPSFADAHFNLAMAYEELGRARDAKPHWETYLALEPAGSWASIAERYLAPRG